jgi:hypothetical protein
MSAVYGIPRSSYFDAPLHPAWARLHNPVASISVSVNEKLEWLGSPIFGLFWISSGFATNHENNYFELGEQIRLPPDILNCMRLYLALFCLLYNSDNDHLHGITPMSVEAYIIYVNFPWPVSSTSCDCPQRMAWISESADYVDDLKLLERSKHLKLVEIGVDFPFRYSEHRCQSWFCELNLAAGLVSKPRPTSYNKRR